MLHRIRGVRQDEASRERHWFHDDFFDLFVWTAPGGAILGFQLCYDRSNQERVLEWHAASGFSHRGVDDGEKTPIKNMTPILVTDDRFHAARIATEFGQRGKTLDAPLHNFIRRKIAEAATVLSELAD